jgi:hypothetical protein
MGELIKKILDLPVIVQGALGSALFWVIFEISKWLFRVANALLARLSKSFSKETLLREYVHNKFTSHAAATFQSAGYSFCVFHGLRYVAQGLCFLVLGLLLSDVWEVLRMVGLLFAIILFARGFWWLSTFPQSKTKKVLGRTDD